MWIFNPQKFFRLHLKRCETPVLTRFGMHVITWTLATGSQGFDPKRGILLQPYLITSACPLLRTPEPASFPANSDPLWHNPVYSTPHPSRTPSHCPSDPPDFRSDVSPSCPFCSVSHWESTHDPQGSFLLLLLCPMKIAQAHVVKLLGI